MHRLAITWTIPDGYGGMTSALLHRSRAFAELGGAPVDVLTFDPRPDYPVLRERLAVQGELVDGVRLRNVYDELRSEAVEPRPVEHRPRMSREDVRRVRVLEAPDGATMRTTESVDGSTSVEHRRADGSLAVLDERGRDDAPKRLITAFDASGEPLRQWAGAWACYADWVDRVVGAEPTVAIVDSKTMAPFAAHLRRPGLAVVHVVHGSHLAGVAHPYGPLTPHRAAALSRMERFDGVVFLTERQRDEAALLLADPGNLHVVPNGRSIPDDQPPTDRDPLAGAVVANLTPRKRVEHAIDIASRVAVAGGRPRLAIAGDGPDRARIDALADASPADIDVLGRIADGPSVFTTASWMLLTSRAEAAPLVLVEAMARGCLPIAYDIAYGPADVIEDGVTGFLVPEGDRVGAAAAVLRLGRMPADAVAAMREAARSTAERFDDRIVMARWEEVERSALARSARPSPPVDGRLVRMRLRRRGGILRLTARLADAPSDAVVTATFRATGTTRTVRRRVSVGAGGRIRLRLEPRATALLTRGRRVAVALQVEAWNTVLELPWAAMHPDTRSIPRRVRDRLRLRRR